jgi:hypothetical protein
MSARGIRDIDLRPVTIVLRRFAVAADILNPNGALSPELHADLQARDSKRHRWCLAATGCKGSVAAFPYRVRRCCGLRPTMRR